MTIISPLAFTTEEYTARQERLRVSMAEQSLDAMLLFHQESLFYLYGYDQIGYWVFQTAVVPADGGAPTVLCRNADEHLVRDSPFLDDVRTWLDDSPKDPGQITADILRERGLDRPGTRIGIERRAYSLMPYYYDLLRDATPEGVELVDSSDIVSELRHIKSPAELDIMREAGRVMDAGFNAALAEVTPGARECDLHAAVCDAMYRAGGEFPAVHSPIASGPRTLSQTHLGASDRVIEAGDPVTIEIGGVRRRYHAVGAHSVVAGEPTARMRAVHEGITGALNEARELIRPGCPTAELAAKVQSGLKAAGFDRGGRHVGYGIGIGYPPSWLEPLRIKASDDHQLATGMTFFYFAGITDLEAGFCFYLGEPIAVVDGGHERLTSIHFDIRPS